MAINRTNILRGPGSVTYGGKTFYDADIAYLTDRGSYVTNDYVHVDFARIIAPDDAHVFLDYRQLDMTNDTVVRLLGEGAIM